MKPQCLPTPQYVCPCPRFCLLVLDFWLKALCSLHIFTMLMAFKCLAKLGNYNLCDQKLFILELTNKNAISYMNWNILLNYKGFILHNIKPSQPPHPSGSGCKGSACNETWNNLPKNTYWNCLLFNFRLNYWNKLNANTN